MLKKTDLKIFKKIIDKKVSLTEFTQDQSYLIREWEKMGLLQISHDQIRMYKTGYVLYWSFLSPSKELKKLSGIRQGNMAYWLKKYRDIGYAAYKFDEAVRLSGYLQAFKTAVSYRYSSVEKLKDSVLAVDFMKYHSDGVRMTVKLGEDTYRFYTDKTAAGSMICCEGRPFREWQEEKKIEFPRMEIKYMFVFLGEEENIDKYQKIEV
jgi:hypothetical protein